MGISAITLNYIMHIDNVRDNICKFLSQTDQLNLYRVSNLLYADAVNVNFNRKRVTDAQQFWKDVKVFGESLIADMVKNNGIDHDTELLMLVVSSCELVDALGVNRNVLCTELMYRETVSVDGAQIICDNNTICCQNDTNIVIYHDSERFENYFNDNKHKSLTKAFAQKYIKRKIHVTGEKTSSLIPSHTLPSVYELIEVTERIIRCFERWESIIPLRHAFIDTFMSRLNKMPGVSWSVKTTIDDDSKLSMIANLAAREPVKQHWSFGDKYNDVAFINIDTVEDTVEDEKKPRATNDSKSGYIRSQPITVCEFFRQLNINDIVQLAEFHENDSDKIRRLLDYDLLLRVYVEVCVTRCYNLYNEIISVPNIVGKSDNMMYSIRYRDMPINRFMTYTSYDNRIRGLKEICCKFFLLRLDSSPAHECLTETNTESYHVQLYESDILRMLNTRFTCLRCTGYPIQK